MNLEGTPRHKCCVCGRVRYEQTKWRKRPPEMLPLKHESGRPIRTRYGHQRWYCNESPCKETAEENPSRFDY